MRVLGGVDGDDVPLDDEALDGAGPVVVDPLPALVPPELHAASSPVVATRTATADGRGGRAGMRPTLRGAGLRRRLG
ncbi:hypothetical protein GCM10027446_30940 [Angustibacter peucedani]